MSTIIEDSPTDLARKNLTASQLTLFVFSVTVLTLGLFFAIGAAGVLIGIGIGGMVFCAVAAIQSSIDRFRDQ